MLMHLGLHLSISQRKGQSKWNLDEMERIEIRRRVFWDAFVSEKLQSLYLGRPMMIHGMDTLVPKTFLDMYEEEEPWHPIPDSENGTPILEDVTTYSVSNFTHLCTLLEICGDIMASLYTVRAAKQGNEALLRSREQIQLRLSTWSAELPAKLRFSPWSGLGPRAASIHNIVLQYDHPLIF